MGTVTEYLNESIDISIDRVICITVNKKVFQNVNHKDVVQTLIKATVFSDQDCPVNNYW